MAIISKMVVERVETPIYNEHFFGNVKRSQKTEETMELDKAENVTLPKFDKVQIVFNNGNYSYRVTIDKHFFEYHDGGNYFECIFSNTSGNIFEFDIYEDGNTSLREYYSKSEYEDDTFPNEIDDTIITYDDNVKNG